MDLTTPKNTLLTMLRRCAGVANPKGTLPVLANVLLDVRDGKLLVAATDLYQSVSGHVDAEITTPGSVCLPARDLLERVKAMPDGPVRFALQEKGGCAITTTGARRRYTLQGLPGADFPDMPRAREGAPSFELPLRALGQLIAGTRFSVSLDETRAHMNSALFECGDGMARMVSTDGHRLSRMVLPLASIKERESLLIPLKAIQELRRFCDEAGDGDATATVQRSGPCALFTMLGVQFSTKLVDAQFPPYDAVIPAITDRALQVPREQLAAAVRAVSLAASARTGAVKFTATPGKLTIAAESQESGSGQDELAVDYSGPALSVGINARYLLDVLDAIDGERVTCGFTGELDPVVLRPTDSDKAAGEYVAVIMPMRV